MTHFQHNMLAQPTNVRAQLELDAFADWQPGQFSSSVSTVTYCTSDVDVVTRCGLRNLPALNF